MSDNQEILFIPKVDSESPRKALLDDAAKAITQERNNQYGPPTQDFQRTANLLYDLGFRVVDEDGEAGIIIAPYHVAMIMIALKLSRLVWGPDNRDSWLDIAGYAACGHEAYTSDGQW
jgi:hypothetical protein